MSLHDGEKVEIPKEIHRIVITGLVNCPNPPLPFRQVSECRKIRRIIIMANIIEKIMQKIIRSSGGGGFFVPDFKAANNIAWRAI